MAWAHALMGFFVIFNIWGMNNAFGVFQSYYAHVLLPGTSPATIAWIGSFQLFLVFGLGTPIGRAVDAGHFRVFFNVGSALLVVFVFATSWCATWWQLFLVQGVLTGAAMGMVFCSGLVVLMSYFDERNIGLALGLGAAGSSLGGIAYAVLAQRLLPTHGFARTIRITGCLCLGTMVAPNLVFRQRPELRARARQRVAGKFQLLDWNVFKEGSYLLMAAGLFFAFWGVYFGFMISYGTDILHLGPTTAINLLIAMNACNLPGRFLPALISDRCIGPLNTLIPACLLSSMFIWMWVGTTTHSALLVVACFYGFACAGIQVLYASTVHSFCLGAKNQERRGVRAGMVFSVVGVACLTGTPIGGALIKYRMDRGLANPYLGAQCFAGVSLLMGGLLLLASRVVKEGWAAKRA
ncbi:major facilitator superfamily domain-containing protein [Cryomyces antarcticus]